MRIFPRTLLLCALISAACDDSPATCDGDDCTSDAGDGASDASRDGSDSDGHDAGGGPDGATPPPRDAGGDAGPSDASSGADAAMPAPTRRRFTLAVIPDTQYLFDQDRGHPDVVSASLRWIVEHRDALNIAFVVHLGDLVENARADEFEQADAVFDYLDAEQMPYAVPAGNHDLSRSNQEDDARAAGEPYLVHFGAARTAGQPTFGGATTNGYNSYHVFEAAGRSWLLLSLDWRPSSASLAWAQGVIDAHKTLPVIVSSHEIAYRGDDGKAALSGQGQHLWDALVQNNDQVFFTLNGHYWTPARATLQNAAGNDVEVHLVNYQDRYFGGSGMIRLYEFDLDLGVVSASTFSPYMIGLPREELSPLAEHELELVDVENRFVFPLDCDARFAGFEHAALPPPAPVPTEQVVIPGTLAYWRLEGTSGALPANGVAIADASGHHNDLERVTLAGGTTDSIVWADSHHPAQPSRGSVFFDGSNANPAFGGAYLRTVAGAPLNTLDLTGGYTLEVFVREPADCCATHPWMGIVSRFGTGADAGKTGDDPAEPLATLAVPPGRGFQWAVFPTNYDGIKTNWSHETPADVWQHVAIVNDGHHTVMYVDGSPVARNPAAEVVGIAKAASEQRWAVGAYHYNGIVEQSFYGWLGDVRLVDHALEPSEFMTAR